VSEDPFGALGLVAGPGVTDDDVRAAWRRVAAATHPDRADGGDPAAFAAAASAYSDLRTGFGRSEALAEQRRVPARRMHARRGLAGVPGRWIGLVRGRPAAAAVLPGPGKVVRRALARVRGGRPRLLALRIVAAGAGCGAAVAIAGWRPATVALVVGALTWLIRGARRDLGAATPPRPGPGR
jgi:hypothetical protein